MKESFCGGNMIIIEKNAIVCECCESCGKSKSDDLSIWNIVANIKGSRQFPSIKLCSACIKNLQEELNKNL